MIYVVGSDQTGKFRVAVLSDWMVPPEKPVTRLFYPTWPSQPKECLESLWDDLGGEPDAWVLDGVVGKTGTASHAATFQADGWNTPIVGVTTEHRRDAGQLLRPGLASLYVTCLGCKIIQAASWVGAMVGQNGEHDLPDALHLAFTVEP